MTKDKKIEQVEQAIDLAEMAAKMLLQDIELAKKRMAELKGNDGVENHVHR